MDLLPPLCSLFNVMVLFTAGLIFQLSLDVKTLPAESYFVNGHNESCLWEIKCFWFNLKAQVLIAA